MVVVEAAGRLFPLPEEQHTFKMQSRTRNPTTAATMIVIFLHVAFLGSYLSDSRTVAERRKLSGTLSRV